MRNLTIALALTVVFLTGAGPAGAAENTGGIRPDSPFYFLDRLAERVRLSLTFDNRAKAALFARLGNERLAEAATTSDAETIANLLDDYNAARKQASELAGTEAEDLVALAETEAKALERLDDLLGDADNKARHQIEQALTIALARLTKTINKLGEKAGDMPEKTERKLTKVVEQNTKRLHKLNAKLERRLNKTRDAKLDTGRKTAEQVADRVREATGRHLAVLDKVIENAPASAREALLKAREKSAAGGENAAEAILRRGKKAADGLGRAKNK